MSLDVRVWQGIGFGFELGAGGTASSSIVKHRIGYFCHHPVQDLPVPDPQLKPGFPLKRPASFLLQALTVLDFSV